MRDGARLIAITAGALAAGAAALAAVLMTGAGLPGSNAQTSPQTPPQTQNQTQTQTQPALVAAADRKTVTMQFGGWTVTCDEAGDPPQAVCSAAFRILDKNTNTTILTWMLGRSADDRLLTEFFVPTEVLIEPGVAVSLEDGPTYKADFVACGRSACKAILPLDPAIASELASATRATISLTASNGRVTRFSMGIEGIEAALAEIGN